MDALPASTVAFRIPAWVADLPTWLLQLLWMVLGAVGAAVVAATVGGDLAKAGVASAWPATAALLLLLGAGAMAWGVARGRAVPFSVGAGAVSGIGLGLGAPVAPLLALGGFLPPIAALALRRSPAVQAAAVALLAVGILSFQAASGLNDGPLGVLVVAAAALPALAALRGPWRGMAGAGLLLAAFVAML
jgi:hypothetical protein